MMCNELALKFGTTEPEKLIGVLPMEEVVEVIKSRLYEEVKSEISGEYEDRISDLEDEESEAQSLADAWQCDAVGLYRAIEAAIELPWTEGLPLLRQAMADYGKDID